MESPNRQAIRLLREQRKRKKRIAAFLCMAGVVVVGTVMALRMSGRAMNNMALDCVLTHNLPHQHSENCYYAPPEDGTQKVLVCGTADFVMHKHDEENCHDKDGNLVCMLPEIEEHIHTTECYQSQQVLICEMQEGTGGHIHSDLCYVTDYSAEPVCGTEKSEGHTHDQETCYDESGELVCELEETAAHIHDSGCYPNKLDCGMDEGDGAHTHSDACYSTGDILACGKNDVHLHNHTEECYLHTVDQLDEAQVQELSLKGIDVSQIAFASSQEAPAEENRVQAADGMPVLKCGQLQVLEHVHGEDCYRAVGVEGDMLSDLESNGEGAEMPGQRTATYQDGTLRATAIYNGADFPENARVNVERVDENENLPEKQEQFAELMQDEELKLSALLKVTVSGIDDISALSEPIKLTIEPAEEGKVTAMAWYGSAGGHEAKGIYVQNEKEIRLLDVTEQDGKTVAVEVSPEAVVGFAVLQNEEDGDESAADDNGTDDDQSQDTNDTEVKTVLSISQDFEYEDEDYMMVFHINGIARPKETAGQPERTPEPEEEEAEQTEEAVEDINVEDASQPDTEELDEVTDENATEGEPENMSEEERADSGVFFTRSADEPEATPELTAEPEPVAEPEPTVQPVWNDGPVEETVTIAGDVLPANVLDDPENPLGLMVEQVGEDTPEYNTYADSIYFDNTDNGLPELRVVSYGLYYKGSELDLTQCAVEVDVTAKKRLIDAAVELEEERSSEAAEESGSAKIAMAALVSVDSQKAATEEAEEDEIYSMPIDGVYDVSDFEDSEADVIDFVKEQIKEGSAVDVGSADTVDENGAAISTVVKDAGSEGQPAFGVTVVTAENPDFTVQYYAWLDKAKIGTDGTLDIIDTTGKKLPQNGKTPATQKLALNSDGSVATDKTMMQIYTDEPTTYFKRPNLDYFAPKGSAADNYDIKQIWVLRGAFKNLYSEDESFKKIVDASDDIDKYWTTYGQACGEGDDTFTPGNIMDASQLKFTNRPETAQLPNYLHITSNDVIRLVYEPKRDETITVDANFFDYNISDGYNESGNVKTMIDTKSNGINSADNYEEGDVKYAFGNGNTGTAYKDLQWKGNYLNRRNKADSDISFMGCTFGLVEGLDFAAGAARPTLKFAGDVRAPDLFGEREVIGKTNHKGTLTFNKVGDTHTLSIASVTGGTGAGNLDKFVHPGGYNHIWSNIFWPMDGVTGDSKNQDFMFGSNSSNQKWESSGDVKNGGLPSSDDGGDHNAYFGMHFAIEFELTEAYRGPLEYIFFGDDDMWVFLTPVNGEAAAFGDSQLICDIGGVHSSVGEMVNLWDYVKEGIAQKYRLDFYYTERGASGSTCWMQYTLPSVRGIDGTRTEEDYRTLSFGKEVKKQTIDGGLSNETVDFDTGEEFLFKLTLRDKNGDKVLDNFRYVKYDEEGIIQESENDGYLDSRVLFDGAYFVLKKGERIEIQYLPVGTKYTIEECGVFDRVEESEDGTKIEFIVKDKDKQKYDYEIYADPNDGRLQGSVYSGTISEDVMAQFKFINIFKEFRLPETGGAGTWGFTGAGAVMFLAAGCLVRRRRRK